MGTIVSILNNSAYAGWAAAIGTLVLALVTILVIFIGDSYTRLIRQKYDYEFKNAAYAFLDTSLASFGLKSISPGSNISVEDQISKFNREILETKMYLSICNRKKFAKYIFLAKKHALSRIDKDKEIWMRKIAKEMQKLSINIGKENDIENKKNKYPWLFEKRCIFNFWRINNK